jgi:hypothetical protein
MNQAKFNKALLEYLGRQRNFGKWNEPNGKWNEPNGKWNEPNGKWNRCI